MSGSQIPFYALYGVGIVGMCFSAVSVSTAREDYRLNSEKRPSRTKEQEDIRADQSFYRKMFYASAFLALWAAFSGYIYGGEILTGSRLLDLIAALVLVIFLTIAFGMSSMRTKTEDAEEGAAAPREKESGWSFFAKFAFSIPIILSILLILNIATGSTLTGTEGIDIAILVTLVVGMLSAFLLLKRRDDKEGRETGRKLHFKENTSDIFIGIFFFLWLAIGAILLFWSKSLSSGFGGYLTWILPLVLAIVAFYISRKRSDESNRDIGFALMIASFVIITFSSFIAAGVTLTGYTALDIVLFIVLPILLLVYFIYITRNRASSKLKALGEGADKLTKQIIGKRRGAPRDTRELVEEATNNFLGGDLDF